jgi:PTS system galactitol-specific IIA component
MSAAVGGLRITEDLMFLDPVLPAGTGGDAAPEDVLLLLGRAVEAAGCVRPGYDRALVERERQYPTGLPTVPQPVAVAHTDVAWVIRSAVALARLREPVMFRNMAQPEQRLPVRIVLLLAIESGGAHTDALARAVRAVQRPEWQRAVLDARTPAQAVAILRAMVSGDGADGGRGGRSPWS